MKAQGFFSRDNDEALEFLEELSRRGIFFIEERATQRWIEGNNHGNFNGDWKTNDPHKAMRFESRFDAMTYMTKNQLKHTDWYITEHEFVDKPSTATEDKKAPVDHEEMRKEFCQLFGKEGDNFEWNEFKEGVGTWQVIEWFLEKMKANASQERNRAIDECIDIILNDYQATAGELIVEFGKIKKK